MNEIHQGFHAGDEEGGNGGAEVLQRLIEFCNHEPPGHFSSVREYLDYRFSDVGIEYTGLLERLLVSTNSRKVRLCVHQVLS